MDIDDKRRLGIIKISSKLMFSTDINDLKFIFKDLIVLKCEHDFIYDRFIYTCYCDEFDVTKEGMLLPEYEMKVFSKEGKLSNIKYRRIENGS